MSSRCRTDLLVMAGAGIAWFAGASGTLSAQQVVSITAAPRTFTVVPVAVPAVIVAQQRITFRVVPATPGTILGALRGTLPASGTVREILLTVGVPAAARPGPMTMATVFFEADGRTAEVPVSVNVLATRRIAVVVVDSARIVPPGATFPLLVRLTNLGNGRDSVTLRVVAPTGWSSRQSRDPAVLLTAGGTTDRVVTVTAPAAEAGTGMVRVIAESNGAIVATAEVPVTIVGSRTASVGSGPALTTTIAAARDARGAIAPAFNAALDGAVSDGISIAARASSRARGDAGVAYALAEAGLYAAPPSLELFSDEWRGRVGLSGMTCSDLCGVNVTGRGAHVAGVRGPWRASALTARPYSGVANDGGVLAFARMERAWSAGSWSFGYAHLDDRGPNTRELDAVSLGAGVNSVAGGRFNMEVAERRFGASQRFGWSTGFIRRDERGLFDVRYAYAPGGSRAFARATRDMAASVSRVVSRRFSVNASGWRTADDAASFDRLATSGWTLGGVMALDQGIALSLAARQNGFSALTAADGFGTRERSLDAAVDLHRGPLALAGGLTEGRLSRQTTVGGLTFTSTAPREALRGRAGLEGTRGAIAFTGHVERAGSGAGLPPRQWSYGVRLDRLTVASLGPARLTASAEARRLRGFGGYADPVAVSGSVTGSLPGGERIELSMERNPFFYSPGHPGSTVLVLSASRATSLPRLARSAASGVVYQDRNGNGAREPGEPGLAGVLVRRGSSSATSDARGHYTLGGSPGGEVSIDPRSLPAGWLVPLSKARSRDGSVGVVTVASVEIRLRVIESDSDRVPPAELQRLRVQARDAGGRLWLARPSDAGTGIVTFDALPPGHYQLRVDASESREPLFPVGDIPDLVIEAGRIPAPRTIVVRARPIRFGPASLQRGPQPLPRP